jgi:hypothetical protein
MEGLYSIELLVREPALIPCKTKVESTAWNYLFIEELEARKLIYRSLT